MTLSIRAKWTLVLLVVSLAPLAFLAFRVLGVQRAGLFLAEEELEAAVVHEAALAVVAKLDASAGTVGRVAARLSDARISSGETRLLLARDAFAEDDALDYVALYDADGAYIDAIAKKGVTVDAPGAIRRDASAPAASISDRASSSSLGDGAWSFAAPDGSPDAPVYVTAMRVDGKVTGYVSGHLARGSLTSLVTEIAETRLRAKDRLLVVDQSLHVIAGGAAPGANGEAADVSRDPLFVSARVDSAAAQKPFVLTREFGEDDARMVGTIVSLPAEKIVVAARRPEAEAFGALAAARRSVVIALFVVAFLVVVVAAVVAGRTTRPIAELTRVARAYGRRELDARPDVHTGDELAELGAAMGAMASGLAAGEKEIARHAVVEAGMSRYLPREVAEEIARGKASLELGGRRRKVVVVFADIVSFTPYAERASPEEVVALLNEVFTLLSEIVFREGGMVDKFMGDCVMAVFGAHRDEDFAKVCEAALRAADDMHQFVEASRLRYRARYDADVALGIGVAAGEAVVGNLGSESRMEFTVIGDTVNLASRLEGLARPGQTLCAPGLIGHYGELASLGKHGIRGKREPIELFELLT